MDLSTLSGLVSGYSSAINGVQVWTIIAVILSIVAAVLVYALYINSKTEFKGFAKLFRDFLSFKTMYIEALAKMFYIGMTAYFILTSINYLILLGGDGVLSFLTQLVLYPLAIRFAYEFIMVIVKIWHNTSAIAENIGGKAAVKTVAKSATKPATKTAKKK
ncbi:hypothetical protein J6S55_02295 [Candidatus Saccharibacteria bacterium]|nr:hypothetical protein [Candidatus Saccharibacteria bacterium]